MHRASTFLVLFGILITATPLSAEDSGSGMRDYLEQRVSNDPEDATSHRLLGHVLLENGELNAAAAHLRTAVELDPLSSAARFDLGRALQAAGDLSGAAGQWQSVLELAPESDYSTAAEQKLAELPVDVSPGIKTIGYQIHEFPGPPAIGALSDLPNIRPESLPLFLRFETGLLYNSNVALAPSSRQLPPGDRESWQLFASPEIEWWAISKGNWGAGPLFTGYFTLNEGNFDAYNLNSYSPGLFAERTNDRMAGSPLLRFEYRYSFDEFGGKEFSQRHSVLGRMTVMQSEGSATTGYLAIDQTDFADDGMLSEVTSADGTTYAAGISREFRLDHQWFRQFRLGADLDRLDSSGSDFAYWGAGITGQSVIPLMPTVDLTLRAGAGYRIFDRYQFEPDRDELIWRSGCELRKWFTPEFSIAAIVSYQLFDSNNPLFAADRIISGLTMQYRY